MHERTHRNRSTQHAELPRTRTGIRVMINEAVVRGVYAILSGQITRVGATGLITLYIIVFIIEIGKQIDYKLCYLSVWLEEISEELEEKERGGPNSSGRKWQTDARCLRTYPTAWRLRPAASACAVQCHSLAGRQSGRTPVDGAATSKRRVCCQLLLLLPPRRLLLLPLARWRCRQHRNLVVFAQMLGLLLSLRTLVMPPPLQLNELNDNWPLLSLFLVCVYCCYCCCCRCCCHSQWLIMIN